MPLPMRNGWYSLQSCKEMQKINPPERIKQLKLNPQQEGVIPLSSKKKCEMLADIARSLLWLLPNVITQISTDNLWSPISLRQQHQWLTASINSCRFQLIRQCLVTSPHGFVGHGPVCTAGQQFIWTWSHRYAGVKHKTQPRRLLWAILDVLCSPVASQEVSQS